MTYKLLAVEPGAHLNLTPLTHRVIRQSLEVYDYRKCVCVRVCVFKGVRVNSLMCFSVCVFWVTSSLITKLTLKCRFRLPSSSSGWWWPIDIDVGMTIANNSALDLRSGRKSTADAQNKQFFNFSLELSGKASSLTSKHPCHFIWMYLVTCN